jgi:zinc transporter ZupT
VSAERRGWILLSAVLPLAALAALVWAVWKHGTGVELAAPAPVEKIDFLRIEFHPGEIRARIVNSGPEPVTIAAVQIGWTNRASWDFNVSPGPTLQRLGKAVVTVPYPWLPGEPYEIALVSSTGLVFLHDVEVAQQTPEPGRMLGPFALIGVYVGVIPVYLGLLWLPLLRRLSAGWYGSLLSLTLGLLVFLGVDALAEGIETAGRVPEPYQGVAVMAMGTLVTILVLQAVSSGARRLGKGRDEAFSARLLAWLIAFGIGVHNLGEGLAIGGAYALGEVGLGTLLVMGFMIHNVTEGVAIVAPLTRTGAGVLSLAGLGLLAGAPTILGTWISGLAYSDLWSVLFLGIGAGAVFQVVYAVLRHMTGAPKPALLTARNVGGFVAGLLLMYATGLAVVT